MYLPLSYLINIHFPKTFITRISSFIPVHITEAYVLLSLNSYCSRTSYKYAIIGY